VTDSVGDDADHSVDNTEFRFDDDVYTMFTLPSSKVDPTKIAVELGSTPVLMILDTGASLSRECYHHSLSCSILQQSSGPIQVKQFRC